jgi:hypothetical protein
VYRDRYNPNFYGGLQRKYFTPGLIFIFDYNVRIGEQKIYYLKFMCELKTRNWWRVKQEQSASKGCITSNLKIWLVIKNFYGFEKIKKYPTFVHFFLNFF